MTPLRWIVLIALVALFLFAKAWILTHPKSFIALIVGAFLLILSEPANAQ